MSPSRARGSPAPLHTVDDVNPASPHVCYSTIIPRILVEKVMQELYHQQYLRKGTQAHAPLHGRFVQKASMARKLVHVSCVDAHYPQYEGRRGYLIMGLVFRIAIQLLP